MSSILKLESVRKQFGGIHAVDGLSMSVNHREIVGLIGPNGSGKTTLFNVISGVLKPDRGIVRFDGTRIDGMSPDKIYKLGLVRSFQTPRLFRRMTVMDNVVFAARGQLGDGLGPSLAKRRAWREQEEELEKKALGILDFLELTRLKDDYPSSLSGGQLKLLEIGRSLMSDPKMLLLDEPAAGVNPYLAAKIFEKIRELRASLGLTFLIIEHRMELLLSYVDNLRVMHKGRVIAEGTPDEIQKTEQVIQVYLGED